MACFLNICAFFRPSPTTTKPRTDDNGYRPRPINLFAATDEDIHSSSAPVSPSIGVGHCRMGVGQYSRPSAMLYPASSSSRRPSANSLPGPDDIMPLKDFLQEGIVEPKVYKQRPASMGYVSFEVFPFVPSQHPRPPPEVFRRSDQQVRFDGYDIANGKNSPIVPGNGTKRSYKDDDRVDPLCTDYGYHEGIGTEKPQEVENYAIVKIPEYVYTGSRRNTISEGSDGNTEIKDNPGSSFTIDDAVHTGLGITMVGFVLSFLFIGWLLGGLHEPSPAYKRIILEPKTVINASNVFPCDLSITSLGVSYKRDAAPGLPKLLLMMLSPVDSAISSTYRPVVPTTIAASPRDPKAVPDTKHEILETTV
ncbi:hypothetical protein K440DRAFT_641437 [Wilcoxina mikolae CBS 423.85]|nr:hypothetical protein K440DRAFT_641437 [Wilcoxina mikolae CBS 423.85]